MKNKSFKAKVADVPGGILALEDIGFIEKDKSWSLSMPTTSTAESVQTTQIVDCIDQLSAALFTIKTESVEKSRQSSKRLDFFI